MASTMANGIEVHFERFGAEADPAVLLVCGLGAQAPGFEAEMIDLICALGLQVIRYDNRDCGLSTHFHDAGAPDIPSAVMTAFSGGVVEAPYLLGDMAADGMALLDALGIGSAHVVGTSMGGMIAQTMAIEHPDRVMSLTSVMSTTGEPEYGTPEPDCLAGIAAVMQPAEQREVRVRQGIELQKLIGTESEFDLDRVQARVEMFVDRAYDPAGTGRQMLAILASGHRADGLAAVEVPTMVLHGDADRLVNVSGGRRTAELVRGAELRVLPGMGHDLPPAYWGDFVSAIAHVVARAG
jgi:pimeloyl-ACP methyl ester carboxylesterase